MKDGYPDNVELETIKKWDGDFSELMEYIREIWMYADCGYWSETGKNKVAYTISTAGWSGNEEIIDEMMENRLFWSMCWKKSERGGHYVFEIKRKKMTCSKN